MAQGFFLVQNSETQRLECDRIKSQRVWFGDAVCYQKSAPPVPTQGTITETRALSGKFGFGADLDCQGPIR